MVELPGSRAAAEKPLLSVHKVVTVREGINTIRWGSLKWRTDVFLCRNRSSEEDSSVCLYIQVLRSRTGVFLCRYRSSGAGQGCFSVDTGLQEEDRGVSL